MTEPTPLAERTGNMKDPKKQAQAHAEERVTERETKETEEMLGKAEAQVQARAEAKVQAREEVQERLNKIFWALVYIMSGSRVGYTGKIRMVLDKYCEPSIIFSFSDPEDLTNFKGSIKKQFFKLSMDAGLLWDESVVWDDDKEKIKRTIEVNLVGYRLKYCYLRRFNSAGEEEIECDRWDFMNKIRDLLIKVEEMYTIPFLPTQEDEEQYRRAVLDAMKDL